ncbi:GlcNAc-PI de-N-acetylase [Marinomonas spartinae]|uniref:GlcNAc-PI de-N-acetylase n=1 Tax=Marinomonas spartinae TaxID=1792290 RepID=A0A1A8TQH9_9GAMM|nr:PIG-L family deacetylase [Marinomonas spartinae]SBS35697.1 GlcNAc-PI de-N-acetylase [Marinomonas spartinae]
MKKTDYQYALQPDWQSEVILENTQSKHQHCVTINLADGAGFSELNIEDFTWLLAFSYQSTHKKTQGSIAIVESNDSVVSVFNTQYFESGEEGTRYLNLSGMLNNNAKSVATLVFKHCRLPNYGKLLAFKKPDFSDGPILILAPHADDAELAAYGFYRDFAKSTWITTINAGQNVQKLEKQYIPSLDDNMRAAVARKAAIRAWNSMTTPLLAGVPLEQLSSLGYFGLTKNALYNATKEVQKDPILAELTPQVSRQWNRIFLPNDLPNKSSGEALVMDLASLLEQIKPTTVLVTEPEIDPHPEHVMSAHALALAIHESTHTPERVLMYVNHLRHIKTFPYGPEHAKTALPPWFDETSVFGTFSCYSHQLDIAAQKEKVVSFDTMHDLRSKPRVGKMLKRWWNKKVLKNGYQYYGEHVYFQTHIKSNEVFTLVDGSVFSDALIGKASLDKAI